MTIEQLHTHSGRPTPVATHWVVDIYIEPEDADRATHAVARLARDLGEHSPIEAVGHAHRLRTDRQVPAIGAELAAARALSALASRLAERADADIADVATPALHATRDTKG